MVSQLVAVVAMVRGVRLVVRLEVLHLAVAPDRLVGAATSALRFDPARGLVLEAGASVFVSDLSFGDFALDVDISGGAPVIVVRDERGVELEVGGAACAFAQTAMRTLEVVRDASTVSVRVDDAPARACPTSLLDGARVTLGLRGPQVAGTTSARNLRIVRR